MHDSLHIETNNAHAAKPLLRGYLHLGAAVVSLIGTILLLWLARGDIARQISFAIYGVSSIVLFGWSALYHIITWSNSVRMILRRIDHANIFVLIAGTYTPIIFNLFTGGWRIGILTAAWVVAILGISLAAPFVQIPRQVTAGLYVLAGWIVIAALPQLIAIVHWQGMLLLLLAGILYTLGALAYAFKRPILWPRVFGYHEVFHLATIVANALFFVFMLIYVLPFPRH